MPVHSTRKTFQTLDLYLSSIHFGGNNEQNDGKSEFVLRVKAGGGVVWEQVWRPTSSHSSENRKKRKKDVTIRLRSFKTKLISLCQ